jgi:hypothetical protein
MIADSDQSAAVLLKEKLNAAERERDELRRERDEQIAEAASWRATARDKGSSSRAAACSSLTVCPTRSGPERCTRRTSPWRAHDDL